MGRLPHRSSKQVWTDAQQSRQYTTVALSVEPLDAAFGAMVRGLARPVLGEDERTLLRAALADHGVLVLPGLAPDPAAHVKLTRVFGDPDIHPIESIRLEGVPEIIDLQVRVPEDLSAEDADVVVGRLAWHSDLTYTAEPSRGALLCAAEVPPEGGETGFIDTVTVYEALPQAMKDRIRGLEVVHAFTELPSSARKAVADDGAGSVPEFDAVVHPIAHRHPETGRIALNVSPLFAQAIVGMAEDEGQELLAELQDFATADRFTYFHRWQVGDLVVWDNWRTMHAATGHKRRHGRRMLRTTIRGGALTAAA